MDERIKQVRKSLGLKQSEFADKIGIKPNTVTSYETGLRVPSDTVILSICREFGVNEQWLRTGEGDMFVEMNRDEEIAAFVGDILAEESDDFKHRLIFALSRLDENGWKALEQFTTDLLEGKKKS